MFVGAECSVFFRSRACCSHTSRIPWENMEKVKLSPSLGNTPSKTQYLFFPGLQREGGRVYALSSIFIKKRRGKDLGDGPVGRGRKGWPKACLWGWQYPSSQGLGDHGNFCRADINGATGVRSLRLESFFSFFPLFSPLCRHQEHRKLVVCLASCLQWALP